MSAPPGVAALQSFAAAPAVGPEAAQRFLADYCPAVFEQVAAISSAEGLEAAVAGLNRVLATQPGALPASGPSLLLPVASVAHP